MALALTNTIQSGHGDSGRGSGDTNTVSTTEAAMTS